MTLFPSIVKRERVDAQTREQMLTLHEQNFYCVNRERFFADLDEKDWVILLQEAGGLLGGFSTQKVLADVPGADGVKFLFSGDTIIAPTHWNTPYLSGCFGHLMLRLIRENPDTPLFWFLISKGYRTYRFLPVFFNTFWPGPDRETPPEIAALIDAVAGWKFGSRYEAATTLVKDPSGDRLTPALAEVPFAKRKDVVTKFFLEKNPHYDLGHELACLAPIAESNFNVLARRVIAQTQPEWIA